MSLSPDTAGDLLAGVSRLVRTTRSYVHLREQQLGQAGLPHSILAKLAPGPMRPGDLAALLHVSPSAVSRAVAGLVEQGWVVRATDPVDGRACTLGLSPTGQARLAAAHGEQARLLTRLLADWDDDKAATLAGLLGELTVALEQAVDSGRHPVTALTPTSATTDRPQEALV